MPRKKSSPTALHHAPNIAKHRACCTVCAHPDCEKIEHDFISWRSPATIATEYKLGSRFAVYRHADAFGLPALRDKNVRAALSRIIEHVDSVEISGANIIQAISLLGRLNAQGASVDAQERLASHKLYSQMSRAELLNYATTCTPPTWFSAPNDAKDPQGAEDDENA